MLLGVVFYPPFSLTGLSNVRIEGNVGVIGIKSLLSLAQAYFVRHVNLH